MAALLARSADPDAGGLGARGTAVSSELPETSALLPRPPR
ncbi:hypothetical protein SAMN05660690_4553 [Geodermatophilus telluris]|uniref:Uncharacterized protein n=1 Tax=Geodermatophilus telluris TaxID=1190417 RepID=A0A1G6VQJ8_9ACTN|nr:hypothetical protein SAMN05660690_4553 [Geodermatophilus telluris]